MLADFNAGYRYVLEYVSRKTCNLGEGEEPSCWSWPTKHGFSPEDETKAWIAIKESATFWMNLSPLLEGVASIDALRQAYASGQEVYFITNRMGIAPHMQTVTWLIMHGFRAPSVLLAPELPIDGQRGKESSKGYLAKGLDLTHFIDDKPENCFAVNERSPFTAAYLLSKRYNTWAQPECATRGIHLVASLSEFFQDVTKNVPRIHA